MPNWLLILAIVQALIFIALAMLSNFLAPLNLAVRRYVELHRNMRIRPLMVLTHRYNDVLSFSIQLIILALVLGLVWDDWRRAMILLAAISIQTTVVSASKRLASIDRPPQMFSHVIMTSGSYPSGHSAASLTYALLVPTVFAPYLSLPVIIMLATYLAGVALLTAYGRLYLDVHWLTDILGGWSLSLIIYTISLLILK